MDIYVKQMCQKLVNEFKQKCENSYAKLYEF